MPGEAGKSRLVAYAGRPGAFGEMACRARFPDRQPIGMAGFAAVVQAIADGRVPCGMIPLCNSGAGAVPGVAELLRSDAVRVTGHHALPVAMHCLALPGATIAGLREVHSHPVALRQCERFLARTGLLAVTADDTAQAAQMVRERGDVGVAALGSARAGELYSLHTLAAAVQDAENNTTTFAVVERA